MIGCFLNILLAVLLQTNPGNNSSKPAPSQVPQQNADVCQNLKIPAHITLAKALTGNERVLFCSIFTDEQRDMVVAYTKKKPPLMPKMAVLQVAKDLDLIDSKKPGDACGTG